MPAHPIDDFVKRFHEQINQDDENENDIDNNNRLNSRGEASVGCWSMMPTASGGFDLEVESWRWRK